MAVFNDLSGIRFLSQNVNSLNLSTRFQLDNNLNRFDQKLESILDKKVEIILLQDVRLGPEGGNILRKRLEFNKYGSYDTYTNSTKASRGVAILIKSQLPYKVLDVVKCSLENYLILKISFRDSIFLVGSVYGPTVAQDPDFMVNLRRDILSFGLYEFLIGGDLNMVTDGNAISSTNNFNLDIKNMVQIPNVPNSKTLSSWCETGFIVDIFRHFFPDSRTFSHVPFNKNDHSRSRIDHFLCSPNFVRSFANLTYLPITTKLFDHKGVLLVPVKKAPQNLTFIDPSLLTISGLKQAVCLETLGTFCDYLDPLADPQYIDEINRQLILARSLLADIISIKKSINNFPHDKLLISVIEKKCHEIDEIIAPFLDISDMVRNRPIIIQYDKFLETLMNNLHNCIMSHQRAHKKTINSLLKDMRKRVSVLQNMNLDINSNLYLEQLYLEQKILNFDDDLNLRNCARTKLWHSMNFEKPTRSFCTLAKAQKGNDSLNQLKKRDEQGVIVDYDNDEERNSDICDFFKGIYSKVPEKSLNLEEFLTPEIMNSDYVQSKKLSNLDSERDNVPITHYELTKALEETKIGSSPGLDGFTYAVLKFLWPLIGHPVTKGFEVMVEKEELYPNLRTASIKLIPKKGDCSMIKNWRPISLLSNVYKVFSKAFANRLKRFIDSNTSDTQKAYSKTKVIHEALMNILQFIKKGKLENKRLALLAIDFKKAFDSVSHEYILEILKFYNYSDYMIKIVRTTMKKKMAGVMTESGISTFFEVLCGVAQGDSPSGLLFILCLEPLLWKLALDLGITHPIFENGSQITDSSYADDVSILVDGEPENIINVKTILDNFSKLSGLVINVEKTQVLPINVTQDFAENIAVTGFSIVNTLTILGLDICENFDLEESNFNKIIVKIRAMAQFWVKFKLSIVGRINIAKTYLLSQIGYFAPVLSFNETQIQTLRNEIGSFVRGNLKISINTVYSAIQQGGLGMIETESYIDGIKVGLFRRSINNSDFWAREIQQYRISLDFPFHFKSIISADTPCGEMSICARNFSNIFWRTSGNFLDMRIFDNDIARLESGEKLGTNHFRANLTPEKILLIRKLRIVNLVDIFNSDIFSENNVALYLGFRPNPLEIFYLKSVHRNVIRGLAMNKDKACTPILTFFRKIVKGSFKIRRIIDNNKNEAVPGGGLRKRGALAHIYNVDPERDCNFYKIFGFSKLRNNLRSFIFNFTAQTLYHNAMIAHFVQNHEPTCHRCELGNLRPAPRETIAHIFWDCPKISEIILDLNTIIANGTLSHDELRSVIFLGCTNPLIFNIVDTNTICFIVMYYIFSTRNSGRQYNKSKLRQFIFHHTEKLKNPLFAENEHE